MDSLIVILDVDFMYIELVVQYFIYLMHLLMFLLYYLIEVFHYLNYFIDGYYQPFDANFVYYSLIYFHYSVEKMEFHFYYLH